MRSITSWMAVVAMSLCGSVSAQQFSALIDADQNPSTGCSVVSADGTAVGLEWRITATVAGTPPQVTALERARCLGGSFAAAEAMPAGYPVGLDNGIDGADVVEFSAVVADLPGVGGTATVYFLAQSAGGADLLGGVPLSIAGGDTVALPQPALIPTVHWLGLAVICFAVLLLARRHRALRGVAVVLLLVSSGLAWAAHLVADGQVGDWAGETPLATSSETSSSNGARDIDIVAAWAADDAGRLVFRIDVLDLENAAPVANAVAVATVENQPVTVTLSGSDVEGATLGFSIVDGPEFGSLGPITPLDATTAEVLYTPNPGLIGSDSFSYQVDDGVLGSAPATVDITVSGVNAPPSFLAGPDQTVDEDAGAQLVDPWATAISDGDGDVAQDLSFEIVGNTNAALFSAGPTVGPGGALSFTPAPDASGSALITLQLRDDGGTANGGVDVSPTQDFSITVEPLEDTPVAVADAASVGEDTAATSIDVLANDTDVDGGAMSIDAVTQPGNGTVTIVGGGAALEYQPDPDYCNTDPAAAADTFSYTLVPGGSSATVGVSVTCVNDAPVNSVPAAQFAPTGSTLVFAAANGNALAITDIDAGAGLLAIQLTTGGAANGVLTLTDAAGLATISGNGTDSIEATGTLAALNAALDGLAYDAPATAPAGGSVTLTLLTDDQGNSGSGGALTDNDAVQIFIDAAPGVLASVPVDGEPAFDRHANLTVQFSEPVDFAAGAFVLECPSGTAVVVAVAGTGTDTASIDPQDPLPGGTTCILSVDLALVADVDTIDPPDSGSGVVQIGFNTAPGGSVAFDYTGAPQDFVVPAGVSLVDIDVLGAQGGANWANNVNFGGGMQGTLPVTPGETLVIHVGGQPNGIAGGWNGGGNGENAGQGGGGGSDIRQGGSTLADRVAVAGGGGGAGYWSNLHVVGGVGGGLAGADGYRDPDFASNPGGLGATQDGPGANGTCVSFNNPSVAGAFGQGGAPSGCGCEGYGGGGGWYGGAGSGNCRGGGGGSGYAAPGVTDPVLTAGVRQGHGQVTISW